MKTPRIVRLGLFCLLALVVSSPPPASAEDTARLGIAFRRQMRSRRLESRVEAVQKLSELPPADGADLLFNYALSDDAPQVRQATLEVLRGYDDQAAVGKTLLGQLNESTRKRRMDVRDCLALPVLAVSPETSVRLGVVRYLDEFLGTPKGDLLLVINLMDELGRSGDEAAVSTLNLMAQAKFFESHFGYRRSLVLAAAQIKQPSAIQLLIELMPHTDGLAQHDIVAHLTSATGQTLGNDAGRWMEWWNKTRGEVRFPEVAQGSQSQYDDGAPQYYGIPIHAGRIVFVLDTSGSMSGARIAAAKRELIQAIEALPPTVDFDVVAFNTRIDPWQPKLVTADDEAKKKVERAVAAQVAGGTTSSYAALQAAFKLDPEAIYFLSDGAPTDAAPPQILTAITEKNRVRRVSVHTIGIGVGFGPPVFGQFMKSLAEANLGEFRAVNR